MLMPKKTLVIYFSKSGKTKSKAEELAKYFGYRTMEIETVEAYPSSYLATVAQAKRENSSGVRPELKNPVVDIADYDNIILGYPIWYGKLPAAVLGFLENNNFQTKHIFPFCTSTASNIKKSVDEIKTVCKGAFVHDGLRVTKLYDNQVKKWLNT